MAEYIKLKGKFKWAKLVNPEPPFEDEKFGRWSIILYPDAEAIEMVRDLQEEGLKNVLKKDPDEDGAYYVKFSRPTGRERDGKVTDMSPPKVTGTEGSIGNGSEGEVTLEVYSHRVPKSTKKAKAARLFGVHVTKLVTFNGLPQ
jgi:hypothetical protein